MLKNVGNSRNANATAKRGTVSGKGYGAIWPNKGECQKPPLRLHGILHFIKKGNHERCYPPSAADEIFSYFQCPFKTGEIRDNWRPTTLNVHIRESIAKRAFW